MTRSALRVVALSAGHDRSTFASGSEPLDHYFRQRVTQDIRRRVAACFKDGAALAFYLHHGFIPLLDSPMTLFLPLAQVQP